LTIKLRIYFVINSNSSRKVSAGFWPIIFLIRDFEHPKSNCFLDIFTIIAAK
jgi:hypothetical protein